MITPCLSYDDARAAIAWLERALGAEARRVHEDGEGRVAHAELWFGDDCVMLGDAAISTLRTEGPSCTYLVVDDPDARYERATAAGAEVAMGLRDTDYGSRDFAVRDPEGNFWAFGTYRPS